MFLSGCSLGQQTDETQGCVKDDECKGERICEEGICVDPDGSDGDSESAEDENEEEIECTGPACDELMAFCEYIGANSCDPEVGDASSMNSCIEKMMGFRDSGCFDGSNLIVCLAGCAGRAKSCQYIEMCTEDCINEYCM